MTWFRKSGLLITLLGMLLTSMTAAQAGMVSTHEVLHQRDRAELMHMLEREDVQRQLTDLGVDPGSARARVDQMTDEEIAQLNGRITELPVGAGISTVTLLLIIIIIILLV